MTTYTCPKGHTSSEGDFCDTCGTRIEGAAPAGAPAVVTESPAPASTGGACPNCGAPRAGAVRFCEDCGYDHNTGRVPRIDPPPVSAPAGQWTATVVADPGYFALNDIEGVVFPADAAPKTVPLAPPQVRIGRSSASKGTAPELDLAAETGDPGVSHSHALLTLSIDGTWLLSDVGSSNGTWVNDEEQPLGAGQSRTLKDGDQVHVGAWTTITLHAP
ncbi:FHA domain-containing protein [Actinoplanes sp. NEAU-A12]|uniref:FHA domain-containing protein n=1 Tax=Actinoplanes sandaracinus TaxID=3045177 RepID=A0ABT6WK46_9ACTN|nr:FHA domain-containing protein [Actinoplanes sandaracinus]MDI6100106.1 FHA domain-containing protein [Actinoplanes sandaracinus]